MDLPIFSATLATDGPRTLMLTSVLMYPSASGSTAATIWSARRFCSRVTRLRTVASETPSISRAEVAIRTTVSPGSETPGSYLQSERLPASMKRVCPPGWSWLALLAPSASWWELSTTCSSQSRRSRTRHCSRPWHWSEWPPSLPVPTASSDTKVQRFLSFSEHSLSWYFTSPPRS